MCFAYRTHRHVYAKHGNKSANSIATAQEHHLQFPGLHSHAGSAATPCEAPQSHAIGSELYLRGFSATHGSGIELVVADRTDRRRHFKLRFYAVNVLGKGCVRYCSSPLNGEAPFKAPSLRCGALWLASWRRRMPARCVRSIPLAWWRPPSLGGQG